MQKEKENASSVNRTRASSMATTNSTTRPMMLFLVGTPIYVYINQNFSIVKSSSRELDPSRMPPNGFFNLINSFLIFSLNTIDTVYLLLLIFQIVTKVAHGYVRWRKTKYISRTRWPRKGPQIPPARKLLLHSQPPITTHELSPSSRSTANLTASMASSQIFLGGNRGFSSSR
jgi:hypothetical protein